MSRTHTFINRAELLRALRTESFLRYSALAPGLDESETRPTPAPVGSVIHACHCAACDKKRAARGSGDTGHIDHMPGADWHGMERIVGADPNRGEWAYVEAPVSAPAPRHAVTLWYAPMADRSLTAIRTGAKREGWMSQDDILRTVSAAVRRLMSGRGYWDQQDCAAYMLARIIDHAERRTGRPADVIRYMDRAERMPITTRDRSSIAARAVSPLALARLVADWSRREARHAEELNAERDQDGAETSLMDARGDAPAPTNPAPALTPHAARSATEQLTERLGVGALGGVWEALYVLLRDIDTDTAAEELELAPATLRQRTSRGAKWIRANLPTPAALREAMDWYTDPETRPRKMPARQLREGTNAGHAPVKPTDLAHARALCRVELTDGAPERPRDERHADAIEALLAA